MTTVKSVDRFKALKCNNGSYWFVVIVLAVLAAFGFGAAHTMDVNGHHISGMNNQVVWGIPHVFAIFLIVAASGVLNVASIASVFDNADYKPLARYSALLAITLLIGGLLVLVLDLGRPERLIIALTHFNPKSIFTWNILLYSGFILLCILYLWTMMDPRMQIHNRKVGVAALAWRVVLTAGTGSIFGFLVARQAYDAAILAPLFIVLSLALGTAVFILTITGLALWTDALINKEMEQRLGRLLGVFSAATLYLALIFHIANLYVAEHQEVERFILFEGGQYTALFWLGQVLVAGVIPMLLLFVFRWPSPRTSILLASFSVVFGALAHLYVLIIGGQAFPQSLFPGKQVSSSFYDGVVARYAPSLPEILLGLGGVAVSMVLLLLILRVLPFLPQSLSAPE